MTAREQLPAVIEKVTRVLGTKPECFVTHPSELRILHALSNADLTDVARENGWRVVRRVGGRQIEFYKDATVHFQPL